VTYKPGQCPNKPYSGRSFIVLACESWVGVDLDEGVAERAAAFAEFEADPLGGAEWVDGDVDEAEAVRCDLQQRADLAPQGGDFGVGLGERGDVGGSDEVESAGRLGGYATVFNGLTTDLPPL
jgi:hypothetical protein